MKGGKPPWWAVVLLRALAPRGETDDVLGDLEETHRFRAQRHGAAAAYAYTTLETLDMAAALVRTRAARLRIRSKNVLQDYKLGLRMLLKYPGLTLAGGLALAFAIGVGAGWYDLMSDMFRPKVALPGGDRIVEVEMRTGVPGGDERRLLYDFLAWRNDLESIEELGAWRTLDRNLVLGDADPVPVRVAETTAAAFGLPRVPPHVGRPLLEADERPGAPPVVVLGYDVWRQRFGGREDAVGQTVRLGGITTTVVGVMPEGFKFPVNHRLWIPLQLRASYAPLEGPGVRVVGRLAAGATQAQANAEVTALVQHSAAAAPGTRDQFRPRVLAYGGESPGDRSLLEFVVVHLPVLLVLFVACANVATLVYARTATRDAEIATRYALGASRGRIVTQLFIEALVLASISAALGLAAADQALKWGVPAFYGGESADLPFWVKPGLKLTTMLYAGALTVVGAGILGVLPAIKATGLHVRAQLMNLGAGGSTLRFGRVWTSVMIAQVALTVVLIPPAIGSSEEALRDRRVRTQFPTEEYLAAQIDLDGEATTATAQESGPAFAARLEQTYQELARRVAQEPGVAAVTFADRLPGRGPAVRRAEVEASPGDAPVQVPNMWTAAVGRGFFEAFRVAIVAGRDFHDGDRVANGRTVVVNEAFARRYTGGQSPVGRRVRFASSDPASPQPWLEIVGMVRDIGMTPTDLGEAPYVFRAASPATAHPLVVGVRVAGDPNALAPRVRAIATSLGAGLRVDDVRRLDDATWRQDIPMMVAAGAVASVVGIALSMSAVGIFALMSVSVARRTREIGLRSALGASRTRLLSAVFSSAAILVGCGVAAGNLLLILFITLSDEVDLVDVADGLLLTSAVMLTVGILACVEPARRALRINPIDALKEA